MHGGGFRVISWRFAWPYICRHQGCSSKCPRRQCRARSVERKHENHVCHISCSHWLTCGVIHIAVRNCVVLGSLSSPGLAPPKRVQMAWRKILHIFWCLNSPANRLHEFDRGQGCDCLLCSQSRWKCRPFAECIQAAILSSVQLKALLRWCAFCFSFFFFLAKPRAFRTDIHELERTSVEHLWVASQSSDRGPHYWVCIELPAVATHLKSFEQ